MPAEANAKPLPAGSTFAKTTQSASPMSTPIGQKGETLNNSQATRAMNLKPDDEQVDKWDNYPAKPNKLIYLFMALAVGTLLLTIYLFAQGHWIFGIIGIAGLLILLLLSYSFGNGGLKKRIAYESGLLIPAIIVNTAPLELLAMADMSTTAGQEPVYGFMKIAGRNLPNHEIVVNEKVPCVALFGSAKKGYRRHFEARPVCCGFADPKLVAQATTAISKEPTGNRKFRTEWDMLYALRDKIGVSMKPGTILFFDGDLNGTGFK